MSVWRGSPSKINTVPVPSDLVVDCGTDKTLRLIEPVHDDFLANVQVLATGSASPDVVNHTIAGVEGSYYGFDGSATEERLTIKIELLHGYKEGSDVEVHLHTLSSTTGAGDAVFKFPYYISKVNSGPITGATLTATQTIVSNKQYRDYTTSFGTISGTGLKIGDFIIGTLTRTPSDAGDTYGADMLLKQVGLHAEKDTLGSRQRYIK